MHLPQFIPSEQFSKTSLSFFPTHLPILLVLVFFFSLAPLCWKREDVQDTPPPSLLPRLGLTLSLLVNHRPHSQCWSSLLPFAKHFPLRTLCPLHCCLQHRKDSRLALEFVLWFHLQSGPRPPTPKTPDSCILISALPIGIVSQFISASTNPSCPSCLPQFFPFLSFMPSACAPPHCSFFGRFKIPANLRILRVASSRSHRIVLGWYGCLFHLR